MSYLEMEEIMKKWHGIQEKHRSWMKKMKVGIRCRSNQTHRRKSQNFNLKTNPTNQTPNFDQVEI
jgi:hypothetical protein